MIDIHYPSSTTEDVVDEKDLNQQIDYVKAEYDELDSAIEHAQAKVFKTEDLYSSLCLLY